MNIDVIEAGRTLGSLCSQAQQEPVVVEVAGQPSAVLIAYADYQRMRQQQPATDAVDRFSRTYSVWFAEHNRLVDEVGVFGETYRPW